MSDNTDAPNDPSHDSIHADPFGPPPEVPEPDANTTRAALPNLTALSISKMVLIAGLGVATFLPNLCISTLIEERQQRQDGVTAEFTRTGGPEQSLYTPTLIIP